MKRILTVLTALTLLMIAVPGCMMTGACAVEATVDHDTIMKQLEQMAENYSKLAFASLEIFFNEYQSAKEEEKPIYAALIHDYFEAYDATKSVSLSMSRYSLMQFGMMHTDAEKIIPGAIIIQQVMMDEWAKFNNGEISADEYVEFVKAMYGAQKAAKEKTKEDLGK